MSQLLTIQQAISLTEKLMDLVENEQWDEVSILAQAHQTLITQLHLADITIEENRQVADQMSLLIAMNKQLQSRCVEKREESFVMMRRVHDGNRATSAYTDIKNKKSASLF